MSSNSQPLSVQSLQDKLQYEYKKPELLTVALTHKSYFFENKEISKGHNEKLEFLGDAVLDLSLSELLMEIYPNDEEGALSKKRANLVNEHVLSKVSLNLQLDQFLKLGRGEILSGGQKKQRLLASVYEALIGSLFVDAGYEITKIFIKSCFLDIINSMATENFDFDYKSQLQEIYQSEKRSAPVYKLISEEGPAHDRVFVVKVFVDEHDIAEASGKSKKVAEQNAAEIALKKLMNQGRIPTKMESKK